MDVWEQRETGKEWENLNVGRYSFDLEPAEFNLHIFVCSDLGRDSLLGSRLT